MGRPKGEVDFLGTTFLERVAKAASMAFDEVVEVRSRADRGNSSLPSIQDYAHEDTAPIFGIFRALRDAESRGEKRIWILALDYPLVSADVLRFLRAEFESSDAELVVPVACGLEQVLCAGYSTSLTPLLETRIAQGNYALRPLIAECRARVIDEEVIAARFGTGTLQNVNTPEDLERLNREHGQADAPGR